MDHSTDEESRIGGDGAKDIHGEKPEKPLPSSSNNPPQERHITWLDTLRHYEGVLDRKVGVEARAVQRKRPEDRDPQYTVWHNQAVMFLLWMSSTLNLACFATGFLGTTLGLDLRTSLTIILTATFLGSAVPGWCATLGPSTGLRQISISRYSLGWWPSKAAAILNVIGQIGWSSVGSITSGLALAAVSDGAIHLEIGVVLSIAISFVVSIIGLKAVFAYDKFAGLVMAFVFITMYTEAVPAVQAIPPQPVTALFGPAKTAASLKLFSVIYGSSVSWASVVSDYYVEYPPITSRLKIFLLTTLGLALPTCFAMSLGAVVSSALSSHPSWSAAYYNTGGGIGFLIQTIISPTGLAKFLLVLLAFSGIATNSISFYSASLSIQQFSRKLAVVPRFIWTVFLLLAVVLLSLVGRDKLLVFLQNFLGLLGCWVTSFVAVMVVEHYLFRNGWRRCCADYDLEAWDTREKMPVGIGGGLGFAAGIVGGLLGMSSTWYTGVVARLIGGGGGEDGKRYGDVGFEMAFLCAVVVFVPARWVERRVTRR
ncbi:permease for cytosine/purines, uracil, thiamine, allantoin-domain-containing protein [Copromyces sp. CBS 386.78]|nr:permease for cytosine/purines, uracil, thiamine, allantoin-domain-containing protein [Copromyces sp. CBS 386.78]